MPSPDPLATLVLTQADRWDDAARAADARAERLGDDAAPVQLFARAQALRDCAAELRDVVAMAADHEAGWRAMQAENAHLREELARRGNEQWRETRSGA